MTSPEYAISVGKAPASAWRRAEPKAIKRRLPWHNSVGREHLGIGTQGDKTGWFPCGTRPDSPQCAAHVVAIDTSPDRDEAVGPRRG